MEQYEVTGMSCAACQARVEKAVSKVEGVDSCSVSLLINSMGVEGAADPKDIIKAVENAGYGARKKGAHGANGDLGSEHADDFGGTTNSEADHSFDGLYAEEEEMLRDKETPVLSKRLIASVLLLVVLMYFSMGHMMLGFPLPGFMDGNHIAMGLVEMILSAIILYINRKFFDSGIKSLIHGSPNMDTLVAMGAGVSFIWSVFILFKMTYDVTHGDYGAVISDMNEFYFESAAMIVTLITIGKMLEAMSKGRTTSALKGLMKLAPKTATIVTGGGDDETEEIVGIDKVKSGDVFAVKAGENVPVDGVITSGIGALDESALTGESIPVDKEEGDTVQAATTNTSGYFRARATRVGRDTTLSKIIGMVSDAAQTKAPIAKVADNVSAVFVPAVIAIAIITMVVWLILGEDMGFALARGISVLVISCPCALGLATPVAIMVGNGVGAKNGILFKTSESLEMTGRVSVVALDKTGTITGGIPVVTDIYPNKGYRDSELIRIAYSLEALSEHPIARAIVRDAEGKGIEKITISDYITKTGSGIEARLRSNDSPNGESTGKGDDDTCIAVCGNMNLVSDYTDIPKDQVSASTYLAEMGKTCIFVALGGKYLGMIAVADEIKKDSKDAITKMKSLGITPVMLTGDKEETAKAIAVKAGIDEIRAEVMPDEKEACISELKEIGKVAMIGDGINDAPALTTSDVGMAIGAGTDIAMDAADVVLVNSSLMDAVNAIKLSKVTLRNIHENLFWAFFYNVLLIPLAAGVYTHFLVWTMDPMWGAAAMSLSSFCVCMNALRLNLVKLEKKGEDRFDDPDSVETRDETSALEVDDQEEIMEKVIIIEGMMCEHCEATVKHALEELNGVEEATADHEAKKAVVKLSTEVSDGVLAKAIEDKDYKVVGIE